MRKNTVFSFAAILGLIVFSAFTLTNELTDTFKVDTNQSVVNWKAYKVTGQHEGIVKIKDGELEMENGALTGGRFTMDMTSITVTDLSGGMKGKLEGHLKSADFFGVENHPSAEFVITNVVPKGTPGDYKVVGNLTIKDITKEIKFYTNVTEEGKMIKATADMEIDRSEFNVRYGSGSFFENLGDKTIYDEFDLSVSLVVKK